MAKAVSSKKVSRDFVTGLLLGFLVTIYILLILMPMIMPDPAVAPVKYDYNNWR